MSQIQFSFVGSTCADCQFDPEEYKGLTVAQIITELSAVLSSIKPGVCFNEADVIEAAMAIHKAGK